MDFISDVEIINNNLFLDGFQFHKYIGNTYRCSLNKKNKCPVKVKSKIVDGKIMYMYIQHTNKNSHNHNNDPIIYRKSKIYEELKNKAVNGIAKDESITVIANDVLKKHSEGLGKLVLELNTCVNYMEKIMKKKERRKT